MKTYFGHAARLFVALTLWQALASSLAAHADETSNRWLPRPSQFSAVNDGKDCSVYRALLRRAETSREASRASIAAITQRLKTHREFLENCGKERGLTPAAYQHDDTRLAEVCPEQYQAWVAPGFRLQMFEQDALTNQDSIKTLQSEIAFRCGEAPPSMKTVQAVPPLLE